MTKLSDMKKLCPKCNQPPEQVGRGDGCNDPYCPYARDYWRSNKNVCDLLLDVYWATSDQFCGEMSDNLWNRIAFFAKLEMAFRLENDLADAE